MHWVLASGEDAPAQARSLIETFGQGLAADVRDRARLLLSELVTNSVVHSGTTRVEVQAWRLAGGLDVVVRDDGPGFKALPRATGHDDGNGWGLILVDMLSEAWASGGAGEPWVWFHLDSRADVATAASPTGLGLLLDSVKDYAIFGTDALGHVTIWNAGAERTAGYRTQEILGEELDLLFHDPEDPDIGADLGAAVTKGRQEGERWLARKDGSRVWVSAVITPIYDGDGLLRGFADVVRDVTWRRRLDEDRTRLLAEIRALARTDDLTGLPNRRRWHEELDRELARARRRTAPLCVALVDLDEFKEFNDSEGHPAGDRLLCEAAKTWANALRATDLLARHGGDEFAVLLPDCPIDEALVVVERMRTSTPEGMTASVGLTSTAGSDQAEQLMARVDVALYDAKRRGRNSIVTL